MPVGLCTSRQLHAREAGVPHEQLVSTVAGEGDLDRFPREFRHVVRGERGRVCERFMKMRGELRQDVDRFGLEHELVMVGSELLRDEPRERPFIVSL